MDKKGFTISIPQIVSGFIAFFIAVVASRVALPFAEQVFGLTWSNSLSLVTTKIMVYLVVGFIVYVIVYGTIMGKKPNILNEKKKSIWEGE